MRGWFSTFLKHCPTSHINSTRTDTTPDAPTPLLTCRHSRRLSATIFEPPPPLLSFRRCLRLSDIVSDLPPFLVPLDHHFPPPDTDINQLTLLLTLHRNFRSPAAIFNLPTISPTLQHLHSYSDIFRSYRHLQKIFISTPHHFTSCLSLFGT